VGSHLKDHLVKKGFEVYCPQRNDNQVLKRNLGHVIYCIGYTADFRQFPLETAEAHVSVLLSFLKNASFDSLLYLSSTRVYENAQDTREDSDLNVNPNNPNHIFNLTKLAGEACCLSVANPKIRIARVSNVLGPDFKSENFVNSVIKDILKNKKVSLRTTPDSAKDYILVDALVDYLEKIATQGKERLYNVASGLNVTNAQILEALSQVASFESSYAPNSQKIVFPPIDVKRLKSEFGEVKSDIPSEVRRMYTLFASHFKNG